MMMMMNEICKGPHPLYSTKAVLDGSHLFIFIDRMPFLVSTHDNADPLFTLVITPGFYLHHVEIVDQDPASGSS